MEPLTLTEKHVLSHRINAIKPSPTLAVSAKATEMKRAGKPVLSLSVGEPDFPTPQNIIEAAVVAMNNQQTRYTAVEGTLELRTAIANKLKKDNRLSYTPSQITVSSGGKQGIFNLMGALLNPGDEVLIPAPYWVSYPDMAMIFEAKPVIIPGDAEHRLKITPELLEQYMTPKSKLLILNSPSNPTGVAYTEAELKALGQVLLKHPHVYILTDDIYEKILWNGTFCNILNACPELYERTIVLNGVSKAYAMTGWRIGYSAGPEALIKAMTKLQSQSTSNACSISQAASIAALSGDQRFITSMSAVFKERHDYFTHALNQIPGFKALEADGAFYAFVNIQGAMQKRGFKDDLSFSNWMLEEGLVAGVPGSAFGMDGYIRFSFACSMEELTEAVERMTI
jgi:aspartate aminotransferase